MTQQLESDMDDHGNTNAPTCPACGVPYGEHLGLHGTCAEVQQLRASLWPLANALGIQGDQPPDWRPDVALLVEVTCKDLARQRTEVQQLRTQVEQYRTRDSAHEFASKARIKSAERERDRLQKQVYALCDERDAIARLVPLGEETGTVLENIANYIDRLTTDMRDSLPARVLQVLGVADGEQCPKCQGVGRYTYATTATWRGGCGGQALTAGVCDRCWGSGTTDPWPSLREQADEVKQLRAALADSQRLYGAAHARAEEQALAVHGLERLADLHRNLNRRTAQALGLGAVRVDPETGRRYLPSWHDMPERVAALRAGLAEVLGWMPINREVWVHPARVAELRRLAGVKP